MREIKFRAWSQKDGSYINGFNMYGFSLGQGAPEEHLQRYDSVWKKGEFVLEQRTGLKDKNGTEGYESDLIEGVHKETGEKIRGPIVWDAKAFHWGLLRDGWIMSLECLVMCYEHEIIGNIHQDPKLLEDAK